VSYSNATGCLNIILLGRLYDIYNRLELIHLLHHAAGLDSHALVTKVNAFLEIYISDGSNPHVIHSFIHTDLEIISGVSNYMFEVQLAIHFQSVWLVAKVEFEWQGQVALTTLHASQMNCNGAHRHI
jgi:hypothetical protein